MSSVFKRLLVLNSVRLPSRAGKMEALVLESCWIQDKVRYKAVSSVLKMLLVLNSLRLPYSAGKMEVLRSCWVQARARS